MLAAAVNVSVVLPVPLAGLTVNQLPVQLAVHVHPLGATRVAVNEPPLAAKLSVAGVSEVPQVGVPDWLIV